MVVVDTCETHARLRTISLRLAAFVTKEEVERNIEVCTIPTAQVSSSCSCFSLSRYPVIVEKVWGETAGRSI